MPYRLSDPAWLAFQNDINVSALSLPPWGGVVQWGNQFVLVYICPADGSLCRKGEVMLTDVSDRSDLIKNIPRTYDAGAGVWVYHLPAAFMATLVSEAKTVLETTNTIVQTVAEAAGEAAGGLTQPLLSNLTVPLIGLGLLLALVYLPQPRRP